jgi:hypothetical protein
MAYAGTYTVEGFKVVTMDIAYKGPSAGAPWDRVHAGQRQSRRSGRVDLGNIAPKELHDRGLAMVHGVWRDKNRAPGVGRLRQSI